MSESKMSLCRSPIDEMEYANEQGLTLSQERNRIKNPDSTALETICLPKILDYKMHGFITNV